METINVPPRTDVMRAVENMQMAKRSWEMSQRVGRVMDVRVLRRGCGDFEERVMGRMGRRIEAANATIAKKR